jgi:transcriptional regulator with XRE-family HTH domain
MPSPPERDIPAEIRAEMGRQRMTMSTLSELTGIPRTTLAQQINGGARITAANFIKIAKALDVTLFFADLT